MQKKYRQFDLFADLYDENENALHTAVEEEAVEKLIKLIQANGDWKE